MKRFLVVFLLGLTSIPVLGAADPDLAIYGRYEYIRLDELGKTFKAKMDTGARTASLSATDIEPFDRDGEEWVRFRLAVKGMTKTVYEYPVVRISRIKTRSEEQDDEDDDVDESGGDVAKRPVIELSLCIGDHPRQVEVNLTDRSRFKYPLLIGAKAIDKLDAAIDPARKYLAGRPSC